MQDLPHQYSVMSEGKATGNFTTHAKNLPDIVVAPPAQFGGPGDQWSPEDLLMASVVNCFILSFKAISRASKLEWDSIECTSDGKLDKVERKLQFTQVLTKVKLLIPVNENKEKAERLLIKSEQACLISNSLTCESHLEFEVIQSGK